MKNLDIMISEGLGRNKGTVKHKRQNASHTITTGTEEGNSGGHSSIETSRLIGKT